ncbi:MAG: vitamin K epoxide reductase, partial [Chthoniobacterales bacterium]
VVASLTAVGCMGLIALYQIGVIKHLPEPPLPGLDADEVDASTEGYSHLQMGDAFIGLGTYAMTMGLAAMGPKDRAQTRPWIPLALAAKTTADAAQAAKLTYDQFAKHKAACMWCLIAAAATFVSAALAFPEAGAAVRELRDRT